MSQSSQIHFEENGAQLTAVEIGRSSRSPLVTQLHRTLLALGVVISTYQVHVRSGQLVERFSLERQDGGVLDGTLSQETKAALLPLALEEGSSEA